MADGSAGVAGLEPRLEVGEKGAGAGAGAGAVASAAGLLGAGMLPKASAEDSSARACRRRAAAAAAGAGQGRGKGGHAGMTVPGAGAAVPSQPIFKRASCQRSPFFPLAKYGSGCASAPLVHAPPSQFTHSP